jgi:hypothetical protein
MRKETFRIVTWITLLPTSIPIKTDLVGRYKSQSQGWTLSHAISEHWICLEVSGNLVAFNLLARVFFAECLSQLSTDNIFDPPQAAINGLVG